MRHILIILTALLTIACGRQTRIAVINPLPSQAADLALNNDCHQISVTCIDRDDIGDLTAYDAVVIYSRGLFLDDTQLSHLERVAERGIPIFSNDTRGGGFSFTRNITEGQADTLNTYFKNASKHNFRNALRYLRRLALAPTQDYTDWQPPVPLPTNMFYHRAYGQYFHTEAELTDYLRARALYNKEGAKVALIAGHQFPTEGNRPHVDALIDALTSAGMNVYPFAATGEARDSMLRALKPDALVYMPLARLGDDALAQWLAQENIPVFCPYPLVCSHDEWLDASQPVSGGTMTVRIVIPEIDGGTLPLCIATQNEGEDGFVHVTAEQERIASVAERIRRQLALRTMQNKDKRVAICYYKKPGQDALIASGMEVIPSLYNLLKRLRNEGYDVGNLPSTVKAFGQRLRRDGIVLGSYAKGAQEEFMRTAEPVWLSARQYERWAKDLLLPEKYKEVTDRYGTAPGTLLARGDSIAVACVQYGNVLLFPQPRPALGEDGFKLVHGSPVAPPHSYLAPYLYASQGFKADVLIHFGTHGNLEFTPGKNVALSEADWADRLTGNLPHFYLYTTANVGESVIAKRRTAATLITHLTPPYVESGMRQRYATLLADIHRALSQGQSPELARSIKSETLRLGLHRPLGLDSLIGKAYTTAELERLDDYAEEIANEKVLGAHYVLGTPYSHRDLVETTVAICADALAYSQYRQNATHHLPEARERIRQALDRTQDTSLVEPYLREAVRIYRALEASSSAEMNALINALNGGTTAPAPGGDPVLAPNVLPTGRNMYSLNAECTPSPTAWEDGKRLADEAIRQYRAQHGEWPRKVSYTFWAGEFINTEGATLAQALWAMGVEPVRDAAGRVMDLRLVPNEELGRPRVDIMVQVSGQLRDIAASRLQMITDAVRLASEEDTDSNYVRHGTLATERALVDQGMPPLEAREIAFMRVFGPLNNGYATAMIGATEHSDTWDDGRTLANTYINNMCANYGDEAHWAQASQTLFRATLRGTDLIVQPRQSNTWGAISLDHVYEFTGGLSLAVRETTGKEPDALLADYRNARHRRLQGLKEAIDIEARATLLNPDYVREHLRGGEGTAEAFGKALRNVFGWQATRPSALDERLMSDLYDTYVKDIHALGTRQFFLRENPAALQVMTAVMMESARKGYWQPTPEQLQDIASLHASTTVSHGAACTEFVCDNKKLQTYIAKQLHGTQRDAFRRTMERTLSPSGKAVVMSQQTTGSLHEAKTLSPTRLIIYASVCGLIALVIAVLVRRRR